MLADQAPLLLGEDFFPWVMLALGGALVVGNVAALIRPPTKVKDGELARAPLARSLTMAIVGAVAAIWALASLTAG